MKKTVKKLRLKKEIKEGLKATCIILLIGGVLLGALYLYQLRYNQVNGQRPGSIEILKNK